ncbi:uncharacterized protein LOC143847791 [Tasmannia lanceolata]|uniref:uncharacterized protein LOC143847791 n=1 Tax=Tasmannia lanceolata TaxID=3420 RepID=UPI004063E133
MFNYQQGSSARHPIYSNRNSYDVLNTRLAKVYDYSDNSYGLESNSRDRRIATNYNYGNSGGIEFSSRIQTGDDSGISSPPLWKTSPPTSPTEKTSLFCHDLSPNSRLQAIVKGRRELMEMVRSAPESAYELSLQDLVELPMIEGAREKNLTQGRELSSVEIQEKKIKRTKTKNGKRGDLRNKNMDNGHFLKLFFPGSLGLKKRISSTGTSSKVSPKVSPKPHSLEGEKKTSLDREWWKKRFPATRESDHSTTSRSSTSSSNSSRHVGGVLPSCWSIFRTNKSKAKGHKGWLF